ncbi:hybrid sensor histidine kinase/response regulator [Herbaspirillum sp. WKF16]|uniref:hybrid sensor histidine kinase/response regulator n=1 Tax=Herbaspirillum sp. WKF16 TaxID=3028312 RepID=UPI0023A98387|nr:hybrid sensor histidine kinase/response regulator [Herbaspirillum sp. WKF16]WDZ95356.1 hybrid sensor histidine kinase/response regulator [Herbaspirillum sp. WKF16]
MAGPDAAFLAEAGSLFKTLRRQGSSWRAKADSGLLAVAPPLYRRALHALGAGAATAGLDGMRQLSQALEDVLAWRQAASAGFDARELALVERAVAAMEDMLAQYAGGVLPAAPPQLLQALAALKAGAAWATPSAGQEDGPAAPDPSPSSAGALHDEIDLELLPVFLEEGRELMAAVGEGLQQLLRDPGDRSALHELRRALHTVKGSARVSGALRLGHRVHELESGVQRLLAEQEDAPGLDILLALFDEALLQLDMLEQLDAMPRVAATSTSAALALPAGGRGPASPQVRVRAAVLDRLLNQVGEVSIVRSQLENELRSLQRTAQELAGNIGRLSSQLRDVEMQADIRIAASRQAGKDSAQFDPLELDHFTHLQELTRMMAESVNDAASLQRQLLEAAARTQDGLLAQERLTRELQRELMYVRMMKFKSLAQRLQHLVRQLAGETGKPLQLELSGGEAEIDRGILERLVGPLEHLLRNAAVHGIEPGAARIAAGKPPTGRIAIQVALEGNEAVIVVSDDGRGLDLAAIRMRAAELGLAAGEAGEEGDAREQARLSALIFEPGLTTSSQVSELAGRGVGMDVVRAEVSALGGRIAVQSRPGEGACFTMHLPLSLAVKQVCLLRHGAQHYAIPSMLVDKVVQLRGDEMRQVLAQRTLAANGRMIVVHSLYALLGEDREEAKVPRASIFVMLIKSGDDLAAIMVDRVSGNREVVVKPLGPQLGTLVGVVGATVLGGGEIALILNPLLLAQRTGAHESDAHTPSQPTLPAPKVAMVVDDSPTVRKVMQRLLAREGYAVLTATDGYDAVRQLQETVPDVFLVDIEMPRMDGFALVRHLRDNLSTRDRPIIMITSRTGAKHREQAMELGVNHYLGKPYQDGQLLALIRHCTGGAGQARTDDFGDILY